MPSPCSRIAVVVVDDDASFRNGLTENLADDGHTVAEYDDPDHVPADALRTADVVVTDYQMGATDGLTFADRVHGLRPDAVFVLATAYWTIEIEAAVAARPFIHLCRKPMDYDEVHGLVHRLAVGS